MILILALFTGGKTEYLSGNSLEPKGDKLFARAFIFHKRFQVDCIDTQKQKKQIVKSIYKKKVCTMDYRKRLTQSYASEILIGWSANISQTADISLICYLTQCSEYFEDSCYLREAQFFPRNWDRQKPHKRIFVLSTFCNMVSNVLDSILAVDKLILYEKLNVDGVMSVEQYSYLKVTEA